MTCVSEDPQPFQFSAAASAGEGEHLGPGHPGAGSSSALSCRCGARSGAESVARCQLRRGRWLGGSAAEPAVQGAGTGGQAEQQQRHPEAVQEGLAVADAGDVDEGIPLPGMGADRGTRMDGPGRGGLGRLQRFCNAWN
jgi:hypothetical protein